MALQAINRYLCAQHMQPDCHICFPVCAKHHVMDCVPCARERDHLTPREEQRVGAAIAESRHQEGRETHFTTLSAANAARQPEYGPDAGNESLLYWSTALAGEVGELCNVVKKLDREARGQKSSRAGVADLADEIADVAIYLDLMATSAGVDLQAAIVRKFNATSDKLGLKTRMVL